MKRRIMRRGLLGVWLGGCLLCLTACMPVLTARPLSESTLAPIRTDYQAPQGDSVAERTISAALYFLSYDGTQLFSEVQEVPVLSGQSMEEAVLEALFAGPKSAALRPIASDLSLGEGEEPVEICAGVATVNIGAQARLLSPWELYVVRMAIASTLIELPDIDYVNVLVEGREEGQDLAALMPMGTL